MKNHFLYPIVCLCALFTSCDALENMKCLQEKPIKESVQGFIQTKNDADLVVMSCYKELKMYHNYSRYYHTVSECLSDYCEGNGSYAPGSLMQGLDPTLNERTGNVWAHMYRCIKTCNSILLNMNLANGMSTAEKNQVEAEVRFLRAYVYQILTQCWGPVPFITEKNMGEDGYVRTDVETIWAAGVEDLLFAVENLPEEQELIGRATKYAAATTLCYQYLLQKNYSAAAAAARIVMDSGRFSLVEVSTSEDFKKLFGPDILTTPEEIFYYKYIVADADHNYLSNCFAVMLHAIGEEGAAYFGETRYGGIKTYASNKCIADWPDADLRKEFNMYSADYGGVETLYNKKFWTTEVNGERCANDAPIYRYADVLLYYAEAEAFANGSPDAKALEALNMIHRRAYGYPSTVASPVDYSLSSFADNEAFLKTILSERCYEFCYEAKRWNDLKRVGKLAEYIKYARGVDVGPGGYYWPISNDEIINNKLLDPAKDQNPGY